MSYSLRDLLIRSKLLWTGYGLMGIIVQDWSRPDNGIKIERGIRIWIRIESLLIHNTACSLQLPATVC